MEEHSLIQHVIRQIRGMKIYKGHYTRRHHLL